MDDNYVDLKELNRLLKACRANGVTEFTLGTMIIKFGVEYIPSDTVPYNKPSKLSALEDRPPEQIIMTAEEEAVLEEIRKSQMMLDDPEAFEQMIIDSHLERAREPLDG